MSRVNIKRQVLAVIVWSMMVIQSMAQTFTEVTTIANIPELGNSGATSWADINNDGLPDLLVSGQDGASSVITKIYTNNGDDTFSDIGANVAQVSNASAEWLDYNNDSYLDLLLAGINSDGDAVTVLYTNNQDNSFTNALAGFEVLSSIGISSGDYNNDGWVDVLLLGVNTGGTRVTLLYKNTAGVFAEVTNTLQDVSSGSATSYDFNNDGLLDIQLSGLKNNGDVIHFIYKNIGEFEFEEVATPFHTIVFGDLATGDYNADGFDDVVLMGFDNNGIRVSALYKNNTNETFSEVAVGFETLSAGNVIMADLDNDGALDVSFTGLDNGGDYNLSIYRNTGSDTFAPVANSISGRTNGKLSMGDYDGDNDIDFLVTGFTAIGVRTELFENTVAALNASPAIPVGLTTSTAHDSVMVSWNAATDGLTAANELTYSIYVGTTSGNMNIMSSSSRVATGSGLLPKGGNAGHKVSYELKDLAEGQYFWSVQAVDNAYNRSGFATEGSFVICHNFSIGANETVCRGTTLNFTTGTGSDVVNWHSVNNGLLASNVQSYDFEILERDTLVAEWTKALGCTVYDSLIVDVLDLPGIDLGVDQAICYNEETTLTVGLGWNEVNWYSKSQGLLLANNEEIVYQVLEKDTLIVEVYNDNRCLSYDTLIVDMIPLPAIDLGVDQDICDQEPLLLDVGAGWDEVNWYSKTTGLLLAGSESLDYQVLANDTLIAEVFNASRCVSYDTINVGIIDLPVFELGAAQDICFQETLSLDVGAGWDEVNWYSQTNGILLANSQLINYEVLAKDTLIAEVYSTARCVSYDTLYVGVIDLPVFDLGVDQTICMEEYVSFDLGIGWDEVNWYSTITGSLLANNSLLDYQVLTKDTLVAEVFNASRCVQYDSIIVDVFTLPSFDVGEDTAICYNESILLETGSGWDEVNWYSTQKGLLATASDSFDYIVLDKDTLVVEVFNTSRCVSYDSIIVDVIALPDFTLPADLAICYNENILLTLSSGWDEVNWYSTKRGLLKTASEEFDYTVLEKDTLIAEVYNASRCVSYDSMIVDMIALPDFDLGEDTTICFDTNFSMDLGTDWQQVNWYSLTAGLLLADSSIYTIRITEPMTLIAEVFNTSGCVNYDSIYVDHFEVPFIDAGEGKAVCNNESVTLGGAPTASGTTNSFTYSWTPISGLDFADIANPVANPAFNTEYILAVTTGHECVFTDTVKVEVDPVSIIDLGEDRAICIGEATILGGSPTAIGSELPFEYLWSPSESLDSASLSNPSASPEESTTYTLITKTGGCPVDTSSVTILVNLLPEVIASPDITIGLNETTILSAIGGIVYSWSPKEGLDFSDIANPEASPEEHTLYTVSATDQNGCQNTDSVNVQVTSEIFIPNLFTPNNDGNNDLLLVYGTGIEQLTFKIFDRNNVLVYESKDAMRGWDGTVNGKQAESGNYIWVIEGSFFNGEPLLYNNKNTGIVKLMR